MLKNMHLVSMQIHGEHRVAPAVWSMSAISRPVMEMRGASLSDQA
jgi:hypothetical protein